MTPTCLIVDDEPIAHRVLENHIQNLGRLELIQNCFNTDDARHFLNKNQVDILFLDIQMRGESGFDFLKTLDKKPITIVTTAFLDYSLEGFELGVLDYLVKPIRFERFERSVHRALEFLDLIHLKQEKEAVVANEIDLKSGIKHFTILRSDITHVQALKDYAMIFTPEKKYVIRATMVEMLEILSRPGLMKSEASRGGDFVRVHKSFIVAKSKVSFWAAHYLKINQLEIPIGRTFRLDRDVLWTKT